MLWRPRDVVGGDFYIFRNEQSHCLFGVVDCAGHGVPGALMTMLAHAALDQAINDCGMHDPAAILRRTDQIVRHMLSDSPETKSVATNMDVGLAYVDLEQRQVTFAGAKIALYHCDGGTVSHLPGARRALLTLHAAISGGELTQDADELELAAGLLCTVGELDAAFTVYSRIAFVNPAHERALLAMAEIAETCGRSEEASRYRERLRRVAARQDGEAHP